MRKFTFFFALMVAMVTTAFAQVNYTPTNVPSTYKSRSDRNLTDVKVGDATYELTSTEQGMCYVDGYENVTFTVKAGEEVEFVMNTPGSWTHGVVYIDFDNNGFTAGVTENWKPTGDLVAYSFYNNNSSSDESGWNSVGTVVSGNNRNRPAIPNYTIPAETPAGEYRIRFKFDWCSIDPNGDADGKFGDFMQNGGQIFDAKLVVADESTVEPEPAGPSVEEIAARIAKANEALAPVGVGYPTDAARQVLQEAIAALEAEGTTENYDALATAINTYIATADVVLPENGKYYTLTMVAKNGNKFYLNYTGEDVAMTARGTEELPESAKYLCEANDNGTVSLKTNDGKYLVYHSKYAGVSWLDNGGDTDGFQDAKDAMADITFAKLQNGGKVAASSNEAVFGLLSWYGLRGTEKGTEKYGYMVLKTDGSDFDGADAPFWNDNFSSAFRVEEAAAPVVEPEPEPDPEPATPPTIVSISPTEGNITELGEIIITFSGDVTPNKTVLYIEPGWVVFNWVDDPSLPKNQLKYVAATPITAVGKYTLNGFDISVWYDAEKTMSKNYSGTTFEWNVVIPVALDLVSVTPSAAVESFKKITMEFTKDVKLLGVATDASINVLDENEETVSTAWLLNSVVNGNVIEFVLDKSVEKNGTYSFTVPAGTINSVDGEVYEGGTFTFTVNRVPQTFALTAKLYPTVQEGTDVTEIKGIRVTHEEGQQIVALPTEWTFKNEAGKEYEFSISWFFYDFDDMLLMFNPAITEAGVYTLSIPAGSLKTESGKECEAAEFQFTVVATDTAIDAVDAEAVDNVIYDVTGRRVNEVTKAGIYIVNGKKMLVK